MISSLDEAKAQISQEYAQEKKKVVTSLKAIAGARATLAIVGALFLAFAGHVIYFNDRLPSLTNALSTASIGLPPVDFGRLGEGATEVRDAAVRQGAQGEVQGFLSQNPDIVPVLNGLGLGVTAILLILALIIQADKRKREAAAQAATAPTTAS